MYDPTRPVSSSNPPDSRGERGPKADAPLTIENTVTGENEGDENEDVVYQPTDVAPSPASKSRKTK